MSLSRKDVVAMKQPDLETDPQQLQARLDQLRAGLSHAHRLSTLGTMAAIVAHEYNNILTPMISYAQMALNRPDDGRIARKALEKILQNAERAAQISSSLLGFSREQSTQTQVSVRQAVDDALACLVRDPVKDGIKVHIDLPDAVVAMRPVSLQQVLVNLMLNAVKAMRPRGGRLTIRAQREGASLVVEVADTGRGIPARFRDTIFEPFVSCGDAANTDQSGTGLGLCVCRELVESVGGRITFNSIEGEGTTFFLRLPLAEQSRAAA